MTFLLLGAALVACQDGGSLTSPAELEAPPPLLAKASSGNGNSAFKGGNGSAPGKVADLAVTSVTSSSATLTFTEVDDSKGEPASYVLKYSEPPLDWESASPALGTCTGLFDGSGVGSERTCVVSGLQAGTKYQFRLAAVRLGGGNSGMFSTLSNIASGTTEPESEGDAEPPAEEPADSTNTGDVSDPQPTPSDTSTVDSGSSDSTSAGSDSTSSGSDSTSSGTGSGSTETSEPAAPGDIKDLAVTGTGETSVNLSFTEVDDGDGGPADYDIRYRKGQMDWGSAESVANGTCATVVKGKAIGNKHKCQVDNLDPGSSYEFQLVAFRGTLNQDAVFGELSNVDSGSTDAGSEPAPAAPEQEAPSESSGGGGPNEPAGFRRIFEDAFDTKPETSGCVAHAGLLAGCDALRPIWDSGAIVEDTGPESAANVLRVRWPAGMRQGAEPLNLSMWGPGTSDEHDEFYASYIFRMVGTDWEMHPIGIKILGFFGYGQKDQGRVPNQAYLWIHGPGGSSHTIQTGPWQVVLKQQNHINASWDQGGSGASPKALLSLDAWHRIEYYAKINDLGSANGIFKMWIDGTLIHNHSDVEWRDSENPSAFYGIRYAPVFGGNVPSAGDKGRTDDAHIDHVYISAP